MEDVDSPPPSWFVYIVDLVGPLYLLVITLKHYIIVVLETVFLRGQILAPILQSAKVRDEAFGKAWIEFSVPRDSQGNPIIINNQGPPDTSTLVGSSALIPPILKKARGVVLDVGPGTGTQMPYFLEAVSAAERNVSAIYGAEPCIGLHEELRRRVVAHGLESTYRILSSGAEKQQLLDALRREGVQVGTSDKGVFDTIVCIRVLCSLSEPKETISDLYSLLRPGGQMLIVEHVVNPFSLFNGKGGDIFGRCLQTVFMWMGWGFLSGNCHLTRDTASYLLNAAERDGGWGSVELERRFAWSTLPYISGVLVKKS